MWADTLQQLEHQHLLRLMTLGGSSVLTGALLLLVLPLRRIRAPLLSHFATQCAVWGVAELIWVAYAIRDIPLRDYDGAASLAQLLWIAIGLEAGAILVGITLAIGGWTHVKRPGVVGSGLGIAVQGAALMVLDLILVRAIRL
ncbi:MAG: hypothetical protein M3Y05_03670 [Gemmatimonadota bacterium]|nr:hypothetical protein [Gemmatimonadota bacterium]